MERLGRYVRKGEKGITLCRPVIVKRVTADEGVDDGTVATWFVYKAYGSCWHRRKVTLYLRPRRRHGAENGL